MNESSIHEFLIIYGGTFGLVFSLFDDWEWRKWSCPEMTERIKSQTLSRAQWIFQSLPVFLTIFFGNHQFFFLLGTPPRSFELSQVPDFIHEPSPRNFHEKFIFHFLKNGCSLPQNITIIIFMNFYDHRNNSS